MNKVCRLFLSAVLIIAFAVTFLGFAAIGVKSIKLSSNYIKLQVGKTYSLKVTIIPTNSTNKRLTFSTANKNIATIDKNGTIKGINAGKTVITVTSSSNKQIMTKCNVTIIPSASNSEDIIQLTWLPQNDKPVAEDSLVTKAIEKRFNVKINYIYIEKSKQDEILNVQIASGDIPSVMRIQQDPLYRRYIEQGVLRSINMKDVDTNMPKLKKMIIDNAILNNFPTIWEYQKDDKGNYYGIPILNPNGAYQYIPVWREDWLKNVGINKVPETLTEAEAAFYKFVNNDPDKNGKKDTYAMSEMFFQVIAGAYQTKVIDLFGPSIGWLLKDGKVVSAITAPETKKVYALLSKWYADGLIHPEFITGENKGQYRFTSLSFCNGNIGATCPGLGYHIVPNDPNFPTDKGSGMFQEFYKLQPNGSYSPAKPLIGPSGQLGTTTSWGVCSNERLVFGRNVDDRKLKRVLQIVEAYTTNLDDFLLVNKGVKDVTYTVSEINGTTYYPNKDIVGWNNQYQIGVGGQGIGYMNNSNFEYTFAMNPFRKKYMDKYSNFNTGAVPIVLGNLPSSSQYNADVIKMMSEAHIQFITGKRSMNEWDSFVDSIKKAGLGKLAVEAAAWYEKYGK